MDSAIASISLTQSQSLEIIAKIIIKISNAIGLL